MSNIYPLPKKPGNTHPFRADPTPEGVRITSSGGDGRETVQLIGYEDAVNRLDAGDYDDSSAGFDIHLAVAEGGNCGYFDYTAQHNVTMWRWLIAAAFITEMKLKNGTTVITEPDGTSSQVAIYSNGKVSIPFTSFLSAWQWRTTLRGALIERYGPEQGAEKAIVFYQSMLDVDVGELTPTGREILAGLHDCFIDDIEQNGLPEAPVAH
ncbi:2-polyprenylphenol hydroxylase related flavodoxin oxidoreductase [Klebsiella pneumoniae]|nr:2-polyprenylphenol hydroxylase related flavodoxin oxidoreductase [Klebsiella pneumoniae]SAY08995.1 2-polyprenylphenol hydroxylase related flavodoxin oxidoreductase [Klebsiella pneumoniae]